MKITEKHSKIELSLPRFSVDGILSPEIDRPLPNRHHVWVFSGKPGSGKTSLALSLLTARGKKRQYRGVFDHIFVIMPAPSINSLERNPFKDHPEEKLFRHLDQETLEYIWKGWRRPRWI